MELSPKQQMEQLTATLLRYNDEYYNQDNPSVPDDVYDKLLAQLRELEARYPEYAVPDSPTKRVGGSASAIFTKVQHTVQMASLQDVFSLEEIDDFDRRIRQITHSPYVVEVKIDGLSVSLEYENGVFSRGSTRGDGFVGEDGHYIVYDGQVLVNDLFTADEVRRLIEVFQKYDGRCMYHSHQNSWCDCWEDEYIQRHRKAFSHTTEKPANLIEKLDADSMDLIACCVMFKNVEDLRGAYAALDDMCTMVAYETGIIRMDVYRKGFKKGTGVQYMYERLGIPRENTYAFGDGINDIEMFELVGHGIAMGNAIDELKAVAETVTDDVTDNGVAHYFEKYLLE